MAAATALAAYPSPAADFITVAGTPGSSMELFNQFGHRVQQVEMAPVQRQQLDVRALPAGVYYLRNAATGQSTRFVKAAGAQ
nr:T9SS type A sorting domain-containing protein [Hymenobacter properus]